jgi:hypothetical protein
LKRKSKLKAAGGASSPAPSAAKKPKKKKVKIIKEETDVPDMQGSGGDGVGTVVL